MSSQFFPKLSQNYIELLDDDEYYDVTIEAGEDPNVNIFRAHMNILCYRSPYLRRVLASNKRNNDNILAHIKLPNISPEILKIILKYIYGGILSLDEQESSDILKILIAADELLLQEIVEYLQDYLVENKSKWIVQHFELVHQTGFQRNNLIKIQQFCTNLMAKSPEKIFKSFDFTSLPEKSLILLIKRNDLQMNEIEVWEHVLKWGLAQNPTLIPDPDTWTDEDFKIMENTLKECLPLIRFFSLSSKEFLQKVHPYKKLLKHQLYENLLNSYLDPEIEPNDNVSFPRNIQVDEIIDSKIVNLNIVSTISRWIDKVEINDKFSQLRELYVPYKFKLLLRASKDGFNPGTFHTLCDDKAFTITFVKIKETEEIMGGYNPSIFISSDSWGKTKDSFIFTFKNIYSFKGSIISKVNEMDCAINNHREHGPGFGNDLILYASKGSITGINAIICKKEYYDKKLNDIKEEFLIEDYEVFQIVKRKNIK
ncbi:hypothetical protein RclHR1_02980020 [Rhizophagus clarus]|uniref:BTB domain-containing protein n=1 Tax=Rhizophagus clarus TaxID=94130 RepID=A0A2Z6RKZ7_9GLOM|nr:hypothetical protein RclHR1_02980020 [Rhizophagus clarus]